MPSFQLVPVPEEVAESVRLERRDAFGNGKLEPIVVDKEAAFPCRICLEDARVGDRVLLCSYSPFARPTPYRTVGPIFVHETSCRPFRPSAQVPDMIRRRRVALRAYSADSSQMLDCDVVEGETLAERAELMLKDRRVFRIDVHFARAGCYACSIGRIE